MLILSVFLFPPFLFLLVAAVIRVLGDLLEVVEPDEALIEANTSRSS